MPEVVELAHVIGDRREDSSRRPGVGLSVSGCHYTCSMHAAWDPHSHGDYRVPWRVKVTLAHGWCLWWGRRARSSEGVRGAGAGGGRGWAADILNFGESHLRRGSNRGCGLLSKSQLSWDPLSTFGVIEPHAPLKVDENGSSHILGLVDFGTKAKSGRNLRQAQARYEPRIDAALLAACWDLLWAE